MSIHHLLWLPEGDKEVRQDRLPGQSTHTAALWQLQLGCAGVSVHSWLDCRAHIIAPVPAQLCPHFVSAIPVACTTAYCWEAFLPVCFKPCLCSMLTSCFTCASGQPKQLQDFHALLHMQHMVAETYCCRCSICSWSRSIKMGTTTSCRQVCDQGCNRQQFQKY